MDHDSLSPGLRSNCDVIHTGTVVRSDSDVLLARVSVVDVPPMLSPSLDRVEMVYKVTYPVTDGFIYFGNHIGNYIGNKVVTVTLYNPRQLRALAILSSGIDAIKRINKNHYKVKSQSGNGHYDVVYKKGMGWECNCPNWMEYKNDCKHIYSVQFSMKLRLDVESKVLPEGSREFQRIIDCPECHSYDVVKNGVRRCGKGENQRYLCRSCGYRFTLDKTLSRLKAHPEVVCVCMDLYFKGNSLSKIKHHVKMFYKLSVSRSTIMRWVHKFSDILNEYSERHQPEVGDLWNSDEMTINIRQKGVKHNLEWIWNLMDSDTRFLLASTISHERYVDDASKPLRQGRERAGKKPKVLITDGLQAYKDANRKEFYDNVDPTIHFRTPSKRKYFLNQNIERLNGTVRERLKVMRGFDSMETAQTILDGDRFYYNYIREHQGLNGMTPAQVANIDPVTFEDNPWLGYLLEAIREKRILADC